ncbi:hypothetical protein D3C76_669390 [compost metagenome]
MGWVDQTMPVEQEEAMKLVLVLALIAFFGVSCGVGKSMHSSPAYSQVAAGQAWRS